MTMATEDKRIRAEELQAALALAKQRFAGLKIAFNAMEAAHKRGDYSPSKELQQRLDEFHTAASEVHRLAAEFRAASDSARHGDRAE